MRSGPLAVRSVLLSLLGLMPVFAQAPARPAPANPPQNEEAPYAAEPFVIELIQNKVRFESDGKGERDLQMRIRLQSEAAVREFGLLVYPLWPVSRTSTFSMFV